MDIDLDIHLGYDHAVTSVRFMFLINYEMKNQSRYLSMHIGRVYQVNRKVKSLCVSCHRQDKVFLNLNHACNVLYVHVHQADTEVEL